MHRFWYFAFFLVSGFCSLVYEIVWLRLAMAEFGVTTPIVSTVLSVFMAGLAVGSWGGGVIARRFERFGPAVPLRLYGLAELLIGVSGLLVPRWLQTASVLLNGGGRDLAWNSSYYYLFSGGCVVLLLLPCCTCMGATFPLAMAAIRKTGSFESQRSFSYLYLSNVLGAILGTLIPAFIFIELLGFRVTLRIASSLNAFLAVSVIAFSLGQFSPAKREMVSPAIEARTHKKLYDFPAGNTLWLLFLTGVCTMAMEVVWIRQFTVYLGNVVYSFAVILALYLVATCVGSYLYRHWARSHSPQESTGTWFFLGLMALLPLPFADPTLPVAETMHWAVFRAAAGIGPFSAILGFLTPLLVDHFSIGDPTRAGRAYAVNIVGGILGPLLSGFLILPLLGEHWGLAMLSIPLFGIGLLTVFLKAPEARGIRVTFGNKVLYFATVVCAFGLIAIPNNYKVFLTNRVELRDSTATVIAAQDNGRKRLLINGIE